MHAVQVEKQRLRRYMLRQLRQVARAAPQKLHEDSLRVCAALEKYLTQRYLKCTAGQKQSSQTGYSVLRTVKDIAAKCNHGDTDRSSTLYLLAYYPLFYEIDPLPLVQRLWHISAQQDTSAKTNAGVDINSMKASPCHVCVMLPVVIDPLVNPTAAAVVAATAASTTDGEQMMKESAESETTKDEMRAHAAMQASLRHAMLFVEVFDPHDLSESFVQQGKYNLFELRPELLHDLLVSRNEFMPQRDTRATPMTSSEGTNSEREMHCSRSQRRRRILGCDSWANLFPNLPSTPPPTWLEWCTPDVTYEQTSAAASSGAQIGIKSNKAQSNIVVLAPGVCFSAVDGARLGKGGGYYDRFLQYQRQRSKRIFTRPVQGNENELQNSQICDNEGKNESTAKYDAQHHKSDNKADTDSTQHIGDHPMEVIGIATEIQLDRGRGIQCSDADEHETTEQQTYAIKIPTDDKHDITVDALVTPDSNVWHIDKINKHIY